MKQELVLTKDGSHSIAIPALNATYHSIHGALQESMHVFIEAGLKKITEQHKGSPVAVFEMGFGTGLNALLTYQFCKEKNQSVFYEAIEAFPLNDLLIDKLNYPEILGDKSLEPVLKKFHSSSQGDHQSISPSFLFSKQNILLQEYIPHRNFDLIYYDAFAPSAQPELWSLEIFQKLFAMMTDNACLVTYCSKGDVRRNMKASGFTVEKIPGPLYKREMVRAWKTPIS